jgi:ADP-heptose:LPS heptosyltransferase
MSSPPRTPLEPRRIAIVRALMLGDLLCAVPALRAVRRGFPDAEITLVGLGWARDFAARFSHLVDDFAELPGFPGLPETPLLSEELAVFFARMRARRYDLAVQLHGSGRVTNRLTALLGAPRVAAFVEPGAEVPDPELSVSWPETGHEIHRLLALPRTLGLPVAGDELELPLTEGDRSAVERLAPGLERGRYACIHPGARSATPWPAEHFAEVAARLAEGGLRIVLTGSAGEAATGVVAEALPGRALDLAGRTSLGALGALVEGAAVTVSNDTGVSHVAAAVRAPSVVVVTTSDPDRWAPLDRERHRVVVRPDGAEPVVGEAERLLEPRSVAA